MLPAYPWTAGRTVLRDASGKSIASGGNNRAIVGADLEEALKLMAKAPELLKALVTVTDMLENALEWVEGFSNIKEHEAIADSRKLTDGFVCKS
jgi:hypothetical protein